MISKFFENDEELKLTTLFIKLLKINDVPSQKSSFSEKEAKTTELPYLLF